MPGLGYLHDEDRDELEPEPPMQPFAVDLDSTARPARPLWSWLALVGAGHRLCGRAERLPNSRPSATERRRQARRPNTIVI